MRMRAGNKEAPRATSQISEMIGIEIFGIGEWELIPINSENWLMEFGGNLLIWDAIVVSQQKQLR